MSESSSEKVKTAEEVIKDIDNILDSKPPRRIIVPVKRHRTPTHTQWQTEAIVIAPRHKPRANGIPLCKVAPNPSVEKSKEFEKEHAEFLEAIEALEEFSCDVPTNEHSQPDDTINAEKMTEQLPNEICYNAEITSTDIEFEESSYEMMIVGNTSEILPYEPVAVDDYDLFSLDEYTPTKINSEFVSNPTINMDWILTPMEEIVAIKNPENVALRNAQIEAVRNQSRKLTALQPPSTDVTLATSLRPDPINTSESQQRLEHSKTLPHPRTNISHQPKKKFRQDKRESHQNDFGPSTSQGNAESRKTKKFLTIIEGQEKQVKIYPNGKIKITDKPKKTGNLSHLAYF